MKTYIGTKQVMAEPMNELAAEEKGYARKNEDGHEWRQGYHVQYANPDGTTYDSWSPKNVFERNYRCIDNFIDRLQIEFENLKERLERIDVLLKDGFDKVAEKVGPKQAAMLISQRMCMKAYLDVLDARICDLRDKED